MPRLFGTDGVRGLANADLTVEMALGLAQAAAVVLGKGRVADGRRASGRRPVAVLARDPRVSGEFLSAAEDSEHVVDLGLSGAEISGVSFADLMA